MRNFSWSANSWFKITDSKECNKGKCDLEMPKDDKSHKSKKFVATHWAARGRAQRVQWPDGMKLLPRNSKSLKRAEADTEEKDSQADYNGMMRKSAEKRTHDSTLFSQKSATKANMEGYLVSILWRSQVEKCKMVFTMRLLCAALIASCDAQKMNSAARRLDICVAGNAASCKCCFEGSDMRVKAKIVR